MNKLKWTAIAMTIGALMACGGDGGNPTAPTPPANIAGSYNATITASATCPASLPSPMRVLNAAAEVTQTGAAAQLQFNIHGGNPVTVAGTVSGQTVSFPSVSFNGTASGSAISVVAAAGQASVATNGEIAGNLSGTYQASGTSCNATNHQLQMRKCVVTCSGNVCTCS